MQLAPELWEIENWSNRLRDYAESDRDRLPHERGALRKLRESRSRD